MLTCCSDLFFFLLSECTVAHWPHALAWLKSRRTLSAFRPKTLTLHRAMSHTLPHLMTRRTDTTSSPFPEPVFQRTEQPCEDRRPQLSGVLADLRPLTGYEPKLLAEDRDYKHFTGDGQFTEHVDLRVKPLPFHQSIIASTYDCSSSKRLNHDTFSDGQDFPLRHQQVFRSNEPLIRFSNPANVAKSLLDGHRDHMFAEARSELMK